MPMKVGALKIRASMRNTLVAGFLGLGVILVCGESQGFSGGGFTDTKWSVYQGVSPTTVHGFGNPLASTSADGILYRGGGELVMGYDFPTVGFPVPAPDYSTIQIYFGNADTSSNVDFNIGDASFTMFIPAVSPIGGFYNISFTSPNVLSTQHSYYDSVSIPPETVNYINLTFSLGDFNIVPQASVHLFTLTLFGGNTFVDERADWQQGATGPSVASPPAVTVMQNPEIPAAALPFVYLLGGNALWVLRGRFLSPRK
jgi:hypothetical protein